MQKLLIKLFGGAGILIYQIIIFIFASIPFMIVVGHFVGGILLIILYLLYLYLSGIFLVLFGTINFILYAAGFFFLGEFPVWFIIPYIICGVIMLSSVISYRKRNGF